MGNIPLNKSKERKELERWTKSTGLYETNEWDRKSVKRMIFSGTIAPRYLASECKESPDMRECPICFMYYQMHGLNHTTCCHTAICSECLLQVKRPEQEVSCPYCATENMSTSYDLNSDSQDDEVTTPDTEPLSKLQFASPDDRKKLEHDVVAQNERVLLEELAKEKDHWELRLYQAVGTDPDRIEAMMLHEAMRRSMLDDFKQEDCCNRQDTEDEYDYELDLNKTNSLTSSTESPLQFAYDLKKRPPLEDSREPSTPLLCE